MRVLLYLVLALCSLSFSSVSSGVHQDNDGQPISAVPVGLTDAISMQRVLRRSRVKGANYTAAVRTGSSEGGLQMIKSRETKAYASKSALDFYSIAEQEQLKTITEQFMQLPLKSMYLPVRTISVDRPFIFFHQRKAGGSTLRDEFYKASLALNLSRYIACYGHIACDNYLIPLRAPKAVYAMHIQWGEQKILEQIHSFRNNDDIDSSNGKSYNSSSSSLSGERITFRRRRNKKSNSSSNGGGTVSSRVTSERKLTEASTTHSEELFERETVKFSCMTNFREPVSRLISCIYFRFLNKGNFHRYVRKECIADLTYTELMRLLLERVDKFGNSCLNEPYRILSGVVDEDMLNGLGMDYDRELAIATNKLDTFSAQILNVTLQRVMQCPPLILEFPESAQLIAYKFPIFYEQGAFRQKKALMSQNYDSKCAHPTAEQMQLFETLAAFERVLYDAVLEKTKLAHQLLSAQVQLPEIEIVVHAVDSNLHATVTTATLASEEEIEHFEASN